MQASKTTKPNSVYFFAFDLYSNLPTTSAPPPLCLVCCSEATPSVRELQELEMPEAPQPSLSSYLSLDLPLPPEAGRRAPVSLHPQALPLVLECQAPGCPWGHFGVVPAAILSGCGMLRVRLCLCHMLWVRVAMLC